ncbi:MAG: porin [Proteobacteria bacterium]|nr:porin [Pseudomonadota bacterium]
MLKGKITEFSIKLTVSLFALSLLSVSAAWAEDSFAVDGYGQAWYISDDSDVSTGEIKSEFFTRRARLGAKGKYSEGDFPVKFRLLGEFAGGSATLLDSYLDIDFNPLFQVQVGQFKYHFTEIGTTSSKVKAIGLLYRPEVVQNIHGNLGQTGGSLRDVGVRFHGARKGDITYGYNLEIVNGDGINKADRNDDKVIIAHIFGSKGGVKLFGAYFNGKDGVEGSETDEKGMTAGASYKGGGVWVQAEYAAATYDQTGAGDLKPKGWYLQAAYDVMPELQLLARYDWAEEASNQSDNEMTTTAIGVNYRISKRATISANYFMRDADNNYDEKTLLGRSGSETLTGSKVGNVLVTQFEYVF